MLRLIWLTAWESYLVKSLAMHSSRVPLHSILSASAFPSLSMTSQANSALWSSSQSK